VVFQKAMKSVHILTRALLRGRKKIHEQLKIQHKFVINPQVEIILYLSQLSHEQSYSKSYLALMWIMQLLYFLDIYC